MNDERIELYRRTAMPWKQKDANRSTMNNQFQQQLDTIVQKIVSSYQPEKIVLFGSAARGRMNAESDIDLFIVKPHQKPRHQRSTEVYDLLWDVDRPPLDVLVYTPEEVQQRLALGDWFVKRVMDEGKVLYGRAH